ncbi:MAG: hypothetical protein ACKOXB_11735 [Flavobacteriales bacterium]
MIKKNFEALLQIQEKMKSFSFEYSGIDFWPFLRMVIGYKENLKVPQISAQEIQKYKTKHTFKQKLGLSLLFFRQYRAIKKVSFKRIKSIDALEGADILYFSHVLHMKMRDGEEVNVWTSPILKILQKHYSFRQQTLIITEDGSRGEINEALQYINKRYFRTRGIEYFFSALGIDRFGINEMNGMKELIAELEQSPLGVTITMGTMYERIGLMACKIQFFKKLFRAKKPRAIFLYSFYMDSYLAIVYAARSLGIPVIEIQHGLIKPWHFAYSHWNQSERKSIFFLPDYCLTHDEETARLINETSGQHTQAHYIGNFNLIEELRQRKEHTQTLLSKEDPKEEHILVTTSGNDFLPAELSAAIAADSKYIWHIKLHPRYTLDTLYARYKTTFTGSNVRIYYNENVSVYDFFQLCKVHITENSYVAIEAEAAGLKNIIIGDLGRDAFADQIEKGIYYTCLSETDIHDTLSDHTIFEKNKNSSYPDNAEERFLNFYKKTILKK